MDLLAQFTAPELRFNVGNGMNEFSGLRTVGFRIGTYASGSVSVAPVHGVKFVPEKMVKVVDVFQQFVRNSNYDVYSPETLQGHWKQLTVRVGIQTNQVMVTVGFHPQMLTTEELSALKQSLRKFFMEEDGAELKVDSLYFEISKRREKGCDVAPPELLFGNAFIEEVMCGLTFKISPLSFFQINTLAAELLNESIKQLAQINQNTTVLDVCCGTGTLGLCVAKDCKRVLGIEIVPQAVEDAKENARKNNIENSEFFCGKADDILTSVVNRAKDEDLVAILDPPRAGLHQRAILRLRKTENLERLVFLSCDCKSAFKNFTELGRAPSKTLLGDPFVPVAAIPVDMFPHTNHFEFIIYFERLSLAMKNNQKEKSASSDGNVKEESSN